MYSCFCQCFNQRNLTSGKKIANSICSKFFNLWQNMIPPGACTIKLFMAVIYKCSYKARVFVLGKPFQPSLMFVGEARCLP